MKLLHPVCRWTLMTATLVLLTACGSPEQRSQGYYERGMALIETKDDVAARSELLNAIKFKGDKIEAWRALAGIDQRSKYAQGLFQDLRRIVELDPSDTDARVKLGKMLLDGGAPEAALKIVEAAGDSGNQNASVLALKAAILGTMKDPSGAAGEAQKAAEIDPGNIDAAIVLASEKLSKGDAEGALRILQAPIIIAKSDLRVELLRVQILAQKGDLTQSESILRKLIEQRPQEMVLRSTIAQIYIQQRRFDDAEKEFRAIAAANPSNTNAQLDLVRFLNGTKGLAAGRDELASLIKAGGDIFLYQIELAELDFRQGKYDDSVSLLNSLITGQGLPEHVLAAQTKLAELQFRKPDYPAAERSAGDILRKDPRNVTGLKLRASIRIERGDIEGAISDLREALNGQPKSPDLLLLMALAYEKDGKIELAERQYADAVKSSTGNSGLILRFVAFLQRQGKLAQAEEYLTDAANLNARNLDLLSALGQIRLTRQNWTGALAVADAIGKIGNDRGVSAQIRAAAFSGQNKKTESVAALEAAHAAAPDAIQPVNSLVSAYIQLGKPEKAEALLDDLLKKYPTASQLSLLMGNTQLAKNNNSRAASYFKAVIEQQPQDVAGYTALSSLYVGQKNYDEAVRTLKAGLKEQPDNINLRLALSGIMILQGDFDGAIVSYGSIIKDQPNNPIASNNLASLLMDYRTDKRDMDRAYELAQNLKNLDGGEFKDTIGWTEYHRGNYQAAVAVLEEAVAKLPNNGSIRYHLGMTYKALGQTKKASDQLNAALALELAGSSLKAKIQSALQ